jgi:hypothetical protein
MLTTKGMDGRREHWTIVTSSPVLSMLCAVLGTTKFLIFDAAHKDRGWAGHSDLRSAPPSHACHAGFGGRPRQERRLVEGRHRGHEAASPSARQHGH